MQYQILGASDLNISRIAMGCMSLGPNLALNQEIIKQAIEAGINYFDTADLYDKGRNEEHLGTAIKHCRNKVVVATKVGNQWKSDGSGWDWNPSKEYILKAVDDSLRRLQTDYIDLYQLHGGTIDDRIDEAIEAFEILKQQGKIRWYGISSIRPNVIKEWVKRSNLVSVMMQYSLLDRRPEEECFDLLNEKNIGVLARGSLAGGLLINKTPKPYLQYSAQEVQLAADAVKKLSTSTRKPGDVALQFVLQNAAVTSAVVGIRTLEQLEEAVKAITAEPLTEDEIALLKNSVPLKKYEQHR